MATQQWYSVRSLFGWDRNEGGQSTRVFEERVVIFRATSFEEAIAKGEAEAKRYGRHDPKPSRLKYLLAFNIMEADLADGVEVWSSMREIDLSDKEFLQRFYQDENGYTEIKPRKKRTRRSR